MKCPRPIKDAPTEVYINTYYFKVIIYKKEHISMKFTSFFKLLKFIKIKNQILVKSTDDFNLKCMHLVIMTLAHVCIYVSMYASMHGIYWLNK